jgi:drug/metabolite transporter (DMT)-like permease
MGGDSLVTGTYIVASMACTVVGNLLLKTGAGERGIGGVWPFSLLNMHTFLGALAFGMAMIFYLMVLKRTSLNLAQSIFALQFVLVIFAAHLVLGEAIGVYRWVGIALIAVGLLVVALSPNATVA